MTMNKARVILIAVGIVLPHAARLPRGIDWLQQYMGTGDIGGWLLIGGFNAIAWGAILIASLMYRRPVSLLAPALLGFGFLAWAHYSLDLASDAQAAVALVFIPIYALAPITVGGVIGYIIDQIRWRHDTG